MKLENRLRNLSHAQVIEVVHLLGRYLAESPRTRIQLETILQIDAHGGAKVRSAVLGIVDDIAKAEGASIDRLSSEIRMRYVDLLDRLLWGQVEKQPAGTIDVAGALEELRRVS